MAETLPPTPSNSGASPSSVAEQARIRKERREAKIRVGGIDRLNKITGLGGGTSKESRPQLAASPSISDHAADPEEVDISEHFYQPQSTIRSHLPQQADNKLTDDQLNAMMLGFPPSRSGTAPPSSSPQGNSNRSADVLDIDGMGIPNGEDPMLKFLQQMMGSLADEGPKSLPSFPGMPPMRTSGHKAVDMAVGDPYTYLWRFFHALFALTLGLYIALTAGFTCTKLERQISNLNIVSGSNGRQSSLYFFYVFATAEIVLQISRYHIEKGVVQPNGILGAVMGFLPQPWKRHLALVLRYGRIWTTVSEDAMVCVFVLGVSSWLQSA